jgi:hypothetical protein
MLQTHKLNNENWKKRKIRFGTIDSRGVNPTNFLLCKTDIRLESFIEIALFSYVAKLESFTTKIGK